MLESNLYWLVITIITGTIEWSVFKFFLDKSSKLKSSKLMSNLYLLIPISITVFMSVNVFNISFKLTISIIMAILYYKYNYDVRIFKCIFICLFYWMLLVGVDIMASSIVITINSVLSHPGKLLENNLYRLELIIISKSMLLLVIPIIKSIKFTIEISKKEYIYLIIPILANIVSIATILSFVFEEPFLNSAKAIIIFVVSLILLLSNVSLVLIVSKIIKANDIRAENELIKVKMDMQYKHYSSLQKVQSGIEPLFNTQNNILDLVLTEKEAICKDYNIELTVNIDFSKCNFMEIVDVCNLFSNILDNAIEECIKSKSNNKKIKLSGKVINNFYVIKCTNTSDYLKIIKDSTTEIKSTFSNSIGIDCINKTVEKYHGFADITDDDLIITILIPLTQKILNSKT